MDCNKIIENLKNLETIAYGYNINGEVLGMDCSDFEQIMVDAADAIAELNQYKELGSLDRLRELVEADREGRCVVLPCKLHDKVFFIENGCVKETEVDSFHNWTSGRWKISTHTDRMYEHWKGYEIDFSGIGKTVFLSREDAEKALE